MTNDAPRFQHFAAIDWSGAAGERQAGIAVASCAADGGPPGLVRPGHRWSRAEVLSWLLREMPRDTLVGLDLGFSLPFADAHAFFPGWADSPPDAKALWALIEAICADDPHLGAASLVDHPELSAYFRRHGGREGARFGAGGVPGGRGRLRVTERAQAAMGCSPTSNFNLVGAAQVGKASLTGMRVLHRLAADGPGRLPVWPFDPLPASGSVVVEIYTTLAAMAAGRRAGRSKMRDVAALDAALVALGSPPSGGAGPVGDHVSDHATDALLTAAWLREKHGEQALWQPIAMTAQLAHCEGWTFGTR